MVDHAPSGINPELEAKADELLLEDRRGVTAISDMQFWYSEDQWRVRYSHEVYVPSGFPDARLLRGVYGRVYNPSINRRPTRRRRFTTEMDPWKQFLYEEMGADGYYLPGSFIRPAWKNGPSENHVYKREKKVPTETSVNGSEFAMVTTELPEEWADVTDFDKYQISNHGRARSFQQIGRASSSSEPYVMTINLQAGKPVVWFRRGGTATFCRRVDVLVLEHFSGPRPTPQHGPEHLDGDMRNNRLDNLRWKEGLSRAAPGMGTRQKKAKAVKTSTPRKAVAVPVRSAVREQRIFYSDSIEVLWNVTDGTIDLSQQPQSSPIIRLNQIEDLIECLNMIRNQK